VLARVESNLVTTESIVDTKETQSLVCTSGLIILPLALEIKDGSMRVFHADSPSLHGGDAVDEGFAIFVLGFL
jgi:hypothetical protein